MKNRQIAITLAFLGALMPGPIPLTGLHKFYLGQPLWGIVYLLLGWTQIPRIACAIEGGWYLLQGDARFQVESFPDMPISAMTIPSKTNPVSTLASALRELDQLRQEGLVSEYEFEQKRRRLLEKLQ